MMKRLIALLIVPLFLAGTASIAFSQEDTLVLQADSPEEALSLLSVRADPSEISNLTGMQIARIMESMQQASSQESSVSGEGGMALPLSDEATAALVGFLAAHTRVCVQLEIGGMQTEFCIPPR